MRRSMILCSFLLASSLAIPGLAHATDDGAPSVAWLPAAGDADIQRAFNQARSEKKPVLVYWGAKWCPPCNQLKATLFNRQDFIERSRAFVAVSIDGDLPGAQKLGARFKVRGYPTMVLFNPEGAEITRLPGEADAPQVMSVLQLGLAGGRPVAAVLADARAGKPLTGGDWQLLAFYSWDTDEAQLAPAAQRPQLLAALAAACPPGEAQTRLWLKAVAASQEAVDADPKQAPPVAVDAALRQRVLAVLSDPAASRAQMDVLTNWPAEIARAVSGAAAKDGVRSTGKPGAPIATKGGGDRAAVVMLYDAALAKLAADPSLSRADRVTALTGRIELARLDQPKGAAKPKIPAPLLQAVRDRAALDDREITDGYERQAVVTGDAYALTRAGLIAESDALLQANLAKSHSPYYLMSELASNAKLRGDKPVALRWYAEAWAKSVGPATRLQWGASYVNALVELSPQDAPAIEQAAAQVFDEAASQPAGFEERSARSLQRIGSRLTAWNAKGAHAASFGRLQQRLASACGKLDAADAQRKTCDAILATPSGTPARPA